MSQLSIPGTAPASMGEQARRAAARPLTPTVPQKSLEIGLFGDDARQADLVDMARRAAS